MLKVGGWGGGGLTSGRLGSLKGLDYNHKTAGNINAPNSECYSGYLLFNTLGSLKKLIENQGCIYFLINAVQLAMWIFW